MVVDELVGYKSVKIPLNFMVEGFGGSWSSVEVASVFVLTGAFGWWWRRVVGWRQRVEASLWWSAREWSTAVAFLERDLFVRLEKYVA